MRLKLFLIFFIFSTSAFAQKYTIHGTVRDSASGEAIIGATIIIKELNTGTATNSYGFYSVSLKQGNCTVTCSYLG
jgi:hypothetical protein